MSTSLARVTCSSIRRFSRGWLVIPSPAAILILTCALQAQTWSNAQRLNDAGESPQGAIKKPEVCRAGAGGFHILYRHHLNSGGVPMKYRRYFNNTLGSIVTAANVPNYAWDQYICEAGNGDIHLTWENWDDTPNVGWTKSTNGGASFPPYVEITSFTGPAKAPRIAPFGPASGPEVMLVVANSADSRIHFNRYTGASWNGAVSLHTSYPNEYQIFGIARSPVDGTIYAGASDGSSTPAILHYNLSFWTSGSVENTGFFARQSMAVNTAGELMYCWEVNNVWYSKLRSPVTGWGTTQAVRTSAGFGSVIAIPGTNNFYTAYSQGNTPLRIRGKMWTGGAWGSEEVISANLADAQALDARVAIATDGAMLCCWEWWGSGNAEAYYSVRSAPPPLPTGTISGVVRDQFGMGVPNVAVSTTGAVSGVSGVGGVYSISSPIGTFSASAIKNFYTSQTQTNIVVNQNQTTTQDFVITGQAPLPVINLTIASSTAKNELSWSTPVSWQLNGVRIVYRTDHFPTDPNDGTVAADLVSILSYTQSFTHSGLTNGTKYYYSLFAYYQDASRFYSSGVNISGSPTVKPDFDHDGDVDQSDFGHLQVCFSGANIPQQNSACFDADLSGDSTPSVDPPDLAIFLNCMRGANVAINPNCAP